MMPPGGFKWVMLGLSVFAFLMANILGVFAKKPDPVSSGHLFIMAIYFVLIAIFFAILDVWVMVLPR